MSELKNLKDEDRKWFLDNIAGRYKNEEINRLAFMLADLDGQVTNWKEKLRSFCEDLEVNAVDRLMGLSVEHFRSLGKAMATETKSLLAERDSEIERLKEKVKEANYEVGDIDMSWSISRHFNKLQELEINALKKKYEELREAWNDVATDKRDIRSEPIREKLRRIAELAKGE